MKAQRFELSYSDHGIIDFCFYVDKISDGIKAAKQILKDNDHMKGTYLIFDEKDNLLCTIWRWSFNNKIDVHKIKKGELN